MWLLSADGTLELKEFVDRDLEPTGEAWRPNYDYAILSHRWEGEEIDFDEIRSGSFSRERKKASWHKIDHCLHQAREDSIRWAWMDICCIDKRSSAELQEAINSMFRWYERATVCFVYLNNVHLHNFDDSFVKSQWFSRGWTLQELLAPATVKFYDAEWNYLGDKHTLSRLICAATGIDRSILEGESLTRQCSIAQRMSWAAYRTTTRLGDRAYSLIGIFDVSMPMLYGEGDKAFRRLQEEIIKSSIDESIFAWSGIQPRQPGLLAVSLDAFKDCGDIQVTDNREEYPSPYSTTNRGVSITLPLLSWTVDTYLAALKCTRSSTRTDKALLGIFIRRLEVDDQYARVSVNGEELLNDAHPKSVGHMGSMRPTPIYVRQTPLLPGQEWLLTDRIYGFRLNGDILEKNSKGEYQFHIDISSGKKAARGEWFPHSRLVCLPHGSAAQEDVCLIDITMPTIIKKIRLCFDKVFNPIMFLAESRAVGKNDNTRYNDPRMNTHGKDVWEGNANELSGWNDIVRSHNNHLIAIPFHSGALRYWAGMWALKADRISGLDVYLGDGGFSPFEATGDKREQPYEEGTHVVIKRGMVDNSLVWDVTVTDMQRESARKLTTIFRKKEK